MLIWSQSYSNDISRDDFSKIFNAYRMRDLTDNDWFLIDEFFEQIVTTITASKFPLFRFEY